MEDQKDKQCRIIFFTACFHHIYQGCH